MINVMLGDCFELLPTIQTGSIDLILVDLPYNMTQNKWDSLLPFELMWDECKRVLKENGVVLLFGVGLFSAKVMLSNAPWFKYNIIWQKSKATNFLNAKKQPLRKHELISVFYNKRPTYNPQMQEGEPYNKGVRKDQLTGSYGDFKPVCVSSDGSRYPTDIVYFKTAESEGDVLHPTQEPVALLEYLIKTYTNEGDTVLDFCMGSGSCGIASQKLKRKFIGIEKDEVYFNTAVSRITEREEDAQ